MSVTGKAFDSNLLRRIFIFSKPYRKIFYTSIGLTITLALLGPLRPLMTQYILDHYLSPGDVYGLLWMSSAMLFVLVTQSILQYFHSWNTNLLGQNVIRDMREVLFKRMSQFKLQYFDKTPVGASVTRSVSDMETIADIFSEGLIVIIGDILQLAVIISVMFVVDWRLALISLSTIPLLLLATNIFKNKIKSAFSGVRTQVSALNTFVQEHLTGMRIVQIFSRQEEEYKKFKDINKMHRDENNRSVWYYSIFFPVVEILSAISIGLIVWYGAGGVIRNEVTFGNLVAFIMYINLLFRPIRELADKFNTLQMGMVSSERIFKVMDEDQINVNEGTLQPDKINGIIEFRNVWFTYDDTSIETETPNWILKGINFKIQPNEMVAFIGATGAGKSTIINLLNRFYTISKGEILIDNININDYDLHYLRSKIGVVLQDVFLFSDSVLNNITLKNEMISLATVHHAARDLGAADFIESLPGKYDFIVQERGGVLSTGQRQLISFVRAYAYNPSILVLDEATSSIDSDTEEIITKATESLTSKRTSIVIAHRLATIQNADRIIVMEKGEIVESGNHLELLAKGGHYKNLFEIQFKGLIAN
ncbi:MAG: ABC transporter ATP-binding protein [Bacteroidetes bacterium]|nr:ABC transporter ATP-binding protein [Bacteroidota bacterium]